MGMIVYPQAYHVGYTAINYEEMRRYLDDTGNSEFWKSIQAARDKGLSEGEVLCSFYAKVCYASLTLGKNDNVTRIRDIADNLKGCFNMGHGSVFEHCQLNFIVRDCSRVFTHELIRHRAGANMQDCDESSLRQFEHEAAFSQTSGRYVRTDELNVVSDDLLQKHGILAALEENGIHRYLEDWMRTMSERIDRCGGDMALKKKLTSAMRRWMPNGQANEVGFSCNLRSIRHLVELRTSRHAEKEIRTVFGQIYRLLKDKFPLLFYGAHEGEHDGLLEVSGMKHQPYDNISSTV